MDLYLCEKPSQARDLAAVLGLQETKADHIVVPNGVVTWASGHLLQLPKPDEIHAKYKKWDPKDLPIIPKTFKWVPRKDTEDQLDAIGYLLQWADKVVIATDAEREGELIAQLILNYHSYSGPTERLWIKALDPISIRKALDSPLPGDAKALLYESALLRAKSDWLVGMNASRAASAKLGGPGRPVSIGRVQTPTMAMIVARDKSIEAFKPTPYSTLVLTVLLPSGQELALNYVPKGDFASPAEVQSASDSVKKGASVLVGVSDREVSEPPPELFNLSGLQQKTSAIWGWTADFTLKQVQRLYEHHKIVSYPRSDAKLLPEEQQSQIPEVLAVLSATPLASKLPEPPVIRNEVFVRTIDSAHNAIIPTINPPNFDNLTPDERKAYLLIAKSYLAALHPDFKAVEKTYSAEVAGNRFEMKSLVPVSLGWKVLSVAPPDGVNVPGGTSKVLNGAIEDRQTAPPLPYTDGTLIGDMTSIRQFVTNPKLLDVLKDTSALGTEATRASMLEELVSSGLIERDGRSLRSTPRAVEIVDKLKEYAPLLVDPAETAIWEDGLKRIEQGTLSTQRFTEGIEKRVHSHVSKLLAIPKQRLQPAEVVSGTGIDFSCPVSGLPVRDVGKGWIFPGFSEVFCPKTLAGIEMKPANYSDIFQGKFTPRNFVAKSGSPFFAGLNYNPDTDRIEFDFNVDPNMDGPDL